MAAPRWEILGDWRWSPGKVVGDKKALRGDVMPQRPPSEAALSSREIDLCNMEIGWNSGKSPDPTCKLATLRR